MGDGMSDAYNEERHYRRSIENAKEMEDLALNDQDYKDLLAAHIAISSLIRRQLKTFSEIRAARIEILKKYWTTTPVASIEQIDSERGRSIISSWELRNMIKS